MTSTKVLHWSERGLSTNLTILNDLQVHIMIKARKRANLSIAMGLEDPALLSGNDPEECGPRPSSAPVTRRESGRAQRHILSSEAQSTSEHPRDELTIRPWSCLPDFDHRSKSVF